MIARRLAAALVVAACAGAPGAVAQERATTGPDVMALIGLARTARDRGQYSEAANYFREAARRHAFERPLLVEYFWVAHRADPVTARRLAEEILRRAPGEASVRDGLVGLLVAAHDEAAVRHVAQTGAGQQPRAALWPRRIAESYLREGNGQQAAVFFQRASSLDGGEPADLAQRALAIELTGDKAAGRAAWRTVDALVWTTRPEWIASHARAEAPAPLPARVRAEALPPPAVTASSPFDAVVESRRALAADPCATAPLEALGALADPDAIVAAVRRRPAACPGQAQWIREATERTIARGRFADALGIVTSAGDALTHAIDLREQYGLLLHWTGQSARARAVLQGVVDDAPDRTRAADALVDVLRSAGEPDAARNLALPRWDDPHAPLDRRLALAELALETGRVDEARARAAALAALPSIPPYLASRLRATEAGALLALGRAADAARLLGAHDPLADPATALPWIDAVAATDGVAAALRASDGTPVTSGWVDVASRRAVWLAQMGRRRDAELALDAVRGVDADRAQIARAEVVLAMGRTADAEAALRPLLATRPSLQRARDVLATALAEQGQWDEAFAVLADFQRQRPDDVRMRIRGAEWRHRQSPSPATLAALDAVVAGAPELPDGRSALARACYRAGRYDRVAEILEPAMPRAPDYDVVLLARALRARGNADRALAVLDGRASPTVEMRLLRAEIVASRAGVAAADAEFERLTAAADPDPAWFLAWADVHRDAAGQRRVLDEGVRRLPGDAQLQERLAVVAWAGRDTDVALRAADAAIALERTRTGAWFVKVEAAGTRGDTHEEQELLATFDQVFGSSPSALLGMADLLSARTRSLQDPAALTALKWTDRVLAGQPGHAGALVTRARVLAAQGRIPAALAIVADVTAARPELTQALKLQAELLAASGRYADAVAAYDRYLVQVPGDLPARRQQARVEGWRGATTAALDRYARLVAETPEVPAVRAEADAKHAYFLGRWREAVASYDAWLALEPDDVEARLERAQALDRLGDADAARQAYEVLASRVPAHRVASEAAARLDRRRRAALDLFSQFVSADGPARRQELDVLDAGAGVSEGLGSGFGSRVRAFAGPSSASTGGRSWRGYHVGAASTLALTSALDVSGSATVRTLHGAPTQWFGEAHAAWRPTPSWLASAGLERAPLLENATTLTEGIAGTGPTARVRWQPSEAFNAQVSASRSRLSDDNGRGVEALSLSQRVWHRTNEVRLVATSEHLAYADARPTYFTPSGFWRHDVGVEWRGWLDTPQFFGDKERWVSGAYLIGVDSRHERYQTARVGVAYEFANGVGAVADALVVRSRVYDGARLSFGLRLKHVPTPTR